jgi:hypothetical protein
VSARKDIGWLQQLAACRDGTCLSTHYTGVHVSYLWQCAQGHQWRSYASGVQQGRWCRRCSKLAWHTLDWLLSLAIRNGGNCLATVYLGSNISYIWRCALGHEWNAPATRINQGHWCAKCAGITRRDLMQLQRLAESRGGSCLSNTYVNNHTNTAHSGAGLRVGPTWCAESY